MKLQLAIDIADQVANGVMRRAAPDLGALADELIRRHPEAHASRDEIIGVLAEESRRVSRRTTVLH